MLYLSRLILNLRSRPARADLADVQQLHRTILGAFPAAPSTDDRAGRLNTARQHFGILFRTEPVPDQPLAARVLVQSTHQPDWSHLVPGYLAPATDARGNPAVRVLDNEYDQLAAGVTLRFRLRANPTKRISKNDPDQKEEWRGKRVELRKEEDQLKWLERKAEQGGFQLLRVQSNPKLADARVSPQANVVGRRRDGTNKSTIMFGAALFEGVLEVRDVDQFKHTLTDGIGSGKAYGFGLLSVALAGGGRA